MCFSSNLLLPFLFAGLLIALPTSAIHATPATDSGAKELGPKTGKGARQKAKHVKKRRPRRRGCSTYAPPRYKRMVRNWQKPAKISGPKYHAGFRDLVIYSVNKGERIRIFPYLEDGTLSPDALEALQHILRDKDTDEEHPIHPRLLKLLYRIADKLDAKQINVISGYRASTSDSKESKHKLGMAVDFMIPGTPLGVVAKQIRRFGHVGVGFYPVSGFVHMDVREGPSYFWVDRSGPGKRSCMHRVLASTAAKADRRWKATHDEPVPHKNKKGERLNSGPPPKPATAQNTPAPPSAG